MKRMMSWMLSLCLLFSLMPLNMITAEEEVFEETGYEVDFAEDGFFEEDSFAEEGFVEESVEVAEDADLLEDRSIISTTYDQHTYSETDDPWKVAPVIVSLTQAKGTVTLTWSHDIAAAPGSKTVKYYVYELDTDTGIAAQVGKAVAVKQVKINGVKQFGGTMKIKNLPAGKHSFFVRAEDVSVVNKKSGSTQEAYGASSEIKDIEIAAAETTLWKKLVSASATQTNAALDADGNLASATFMASWTVNDAPETATYTVTRTVSSPKSSAEFTIQCKDGVWAEKNGKVDVEVSGKNFVITDTVDTKGCVTGKTKVTYKIQPVLAGTKGSAKSAKAVTLMGSGDLWKAAPVITSVVQTGDTKAKVTFKVAAPAEKYIFTGFATKQVISKNDKNLVAEDEEGTYSFTADVKSGNKKFKVQPQGTNAKGKTEKGTASAEFALTILKAGQVTALNLEAVQVGMTVLVTWVKSNDTKEVNLYLVPGNVTDMGTGAGAERFVKEHLTKPTVGGEVFTLESEDIGKTFTVFAETILNDGGRLVNSTSVSTMDEKFIDPRHSKPVLTYSDEVKGYIENGAPASVSEVVFTATNAAEEDNRGQFAVTVNGGEIAGSPSEYGANITVALVEGDNEVVVTPVYTQDGTTYSGDKTEGFKIHKYTALTAALNPEEAKCITGVSPASFEVTPAGGKEDYTYEIEVTKGGAAQSPEITKKGLKFSFKVEEAGEYAVKVTVTDALGQTATASAILTAGDEHTDPDTKFTFKYDSTSKTFSVYKYNGNDADVTIPDKVDIDGTKVEVTSIGESAFEGNTSIKTVKIPNAITKIGKAAFKDCTALTTMTPY